MVIQFAPLLGQRYKMVKYLRNFSSQLLVAVRSLMSMLVVKSHVLLILEHFSFISLSSYSLLSFNASSLSISDTRFLFLIDSTMCSIFLSAWIHTIFLCFSLSYLLNTNSCMLLLFMCLPSRIEKCLQVDQILISLIEVS